MEIGQLVLKIQAVKGLQKQQETKKLNCFVCLYLKISICEFRLILLDHITYVGCLMLIFVLFETNGQRLSRTLA